MSKTRTFDTKHPSPRDRSGASDPGVRSRGLAPWRIRRLQAFVEEHLSQSILLADLSDVVGLSVPQFSRAFGQSFGEPPHVYLIQRRLDRARHLMLTSDIKLTEVAGACGFSDQAHFCNLFRRDTGRTPAAWRRERRGGRAEVHEIEIMDLDLPQGPRWGGV
jgi:AraC family transcriptional regulator